MGNPQYKGPMFYTYLDGDKAWELIEKKTMGYNVDIDDLYPENFIVENTHIQHEENIKPMLMAGEEYYLFGGDCDNYCITSFGRILNAKYKTQNVVYFAKDRVTTSLRKTKIYFAAEFIKHGWSFDIDKIKRRYDDNKWKYQWRGINYY